MLDRTEEIYREVLSEEHTELLTLISFFVKS